MHGHPKTCETSETCVVKWNLAHWDRWWNQIGDSNSTAKRQGQTNYTSVLASEAHSAATFSVGLVRTSDTSVSQNEWLAKMTIQLATYQVSGRTSGHVSSGLKVQMASQPSGWRKEFQGTPNPVIVGNNYIILRFFWGINPIKSNKHSVPRGSASVGSQLPVFQTRRLLAALAGFLLRELVMHSLELLILLYISGQSDLCRRMLVVGIFMGFWRIHSPPKKNRFQSLANLVTTLRSMRFSPSLKHVAVWLRDAPLHL